MWGGPNVFPKKMRNLAANKSIVRERNVQQKRNLGKISKPRPARRMEILRKVERRGCDKNSMKTSQKDEKERGLEKDWTTGKREVRAEGGGSRLE